MKLPVNLLIGAVLVALVIGAAALSLVWTPQDFTVMNVRNKFAAPDTIHWLGTDQLGRDLASQLMAGARNSMAVALAAVLLGGSIGTALGLLAAAIGGWVEDLVMRIADIGFAFPALLFAIMLAAVFGPSLTNAVLAIAFINIPVFARVARAAANQVWTREYVAAARAAGLDRFAISRDHILPNIAAPVIVQATIEFAVAILAEAALSYLGLGAQPPSPTWGRMLSEAQTLMYQAPQLAIYPGLCIVAAVMGFGLLGDGLRDVTDPRLVRER
ncbi:ABC transporter permease [Seohaeicola zhoushanensis]|uniref:ABC transporter permease n=1 Tax=Seohaeicola zhoushanensis TaxID=1569283 RepID=A0A8J3M774_9RHOB|nr:ABC transporter permease [Seohaeicola zhoushanensis]GHF34101.1 ABC transporter permease [Seohaeicola zhoushanensis]